MRDEKKTKKELIVELSDLRRRLDLALKVSEERFRAISNAAIDAIMVVENDGKVSYWNPSAERIFGYSSEEALGRDLHMLIAPQRYYEAYTQGFERFRQTGQGPAVGNTLEFIALRRDGTEFPIEVSTSAIQVDGRWCALGIVRDITARKKAERMLEESEAELHNSYFAQAAINMILSTSLENISIEEFLQKALNMILSVPWIAFEAIGNIQLVEEDSGTLAMKAQTNMPESLRKARENVVIGKCLCGRAAETQEIQFADRGDECRGICHEGLPLYGHYAVPILSGGRTLGVINIFVREGHVRNGKEEEFLRTVADTLAGVIMRKQAEQKIEYLAYYDALTGLPNRNLFMDRLNQGIARTEHTSRSVSVLIIDIDRFKSINDTYGPAAGDKVLKDVAERLLSSVRRGDTVARLGNDEFGVALLDVADPDDIIMVFDKIMRYTACPLTIEEDEIAVTLSTGVSICPNDGKNAHELLRSAGLALETAKNEGRKTFQFYTQDMDMKASEFVMMEKRLARAIENEEFVLHYQPYWEITTKKIVGLEALVRWQPRDSGLVPPTKFIPVLEDTRLIIEVGEWILKEAARQVKEWQDEGYPVVPVSVNLSSVQFRQKQLAEMVEKVMAQRGFYPSLLVLEITESSFMKDIEFTSSVLRKLKGIGVSISIDDFGTGYASLSYLKRLPVDNLKIDISFIREMATDPDSASIVLAIINMAHTLNLKTIAEGIETEEQWKLLRLLRCDMGQGVYFSKPLPAKEAGRLLPSQR